eukprot:Filipodium_phascolosomae@DN260_c0_g1_i1.p2
MGISVTKAIGRSHLDDPTRSPFHNPSFSARSPGTQYQPQSVRGHNVAQALSENVHVQNFSSNTTPWSHPPSNGNLYNYTPINSAAYKHPPEAYTLQTSRVAPGWMMESPDMRYGGQVVYINSNGPNGGIYDPQPEIRNGSYKPVFR